MTSPSMPDWIPRRAMKVREVDELLQQSERQVWRLIADGRLQVHKIGSSTRVTPEAIAALLGLM
jgi:predicted DNA-binding transcriptional regulator AlpA